MIPFACPYDHAPVTADGGGYRCPACARHYPAADGVADFLAHALDPLSEEHRQVRDEWVAPADRDYGSPYRDRVEVPFIVARLGVRPGDAVLDLGCGKGRVGIPLLRRFPAARLSGVDFSAPALAAFARQTPTANLARADAAHPPFAPGTFDRAICSMLLPNVADEAAAEAIIVALARALRPGGTAVVTVFNYGLDVQRFGYPKAGYFPGSRVWGRHYTSAEIAERLGRHLTVTRVTGLAHSVPKATGAVDRVGGVRAQAVLDRVCRRFARLLPRACILAVECRA